MSAPGSGRVAERSGAAGVRLLLPDLLPDLLRGTLAAALVWLAMLTWRGFVERPGEYVGPLLAAALLLVVVGWLVRAAGQLARPRLRGPRWLYAAMLPLLVELLALGSWLLHHVTGHWWPARSHVRELVRELAIGSVVAQEQASPVPAQYPEFPLLLLAIGLGLLLLMDLVAVGLREPAAAGMVLLALVAIAASIEIVPTDAVLLVGGGLLWLLLIAVTEGGPSRGHVSDQGRAHWRRLTWPTARILALAGVAALVLPTMVPETRPASSTGEGGDSGNGLQLTNPVLDLGRNLNRDVDLDVVVARTTDPDPRYLRLSTLDDFTGTVWRPGPRDLDTSLPLDGVLPPAPGLVRGVAAEGHGWQFRVSSQFRTSWLPLPYPVSRVGIGEDDWRYTPDTGDVTTVGSGTAAGLEYSADGLAVQPTKAQLRDAPPAVGRLQSQMTALPSSMPQLFPRIARQVTAGARNGYERAVLLQRWFREGGKFRYSTATAPGSGLATLTRFLTSRRVGYCEQFATAMALLARTLDIPSRVAVGFLRPETVGDTSTYSLFDLHAWPELYFEGVGWVRFEPTPTARTGQAPDYTQGALRLQGADPSPEASELPSPSTPSVAPKPVEQNQAAQDQAPVWPWWLAGGLLGAGLLVAAPRGYRELRSRRRFATAADPDTFAAAVWDELRDTALDAGMTWTTGRSPRTVERTLVSALRPDVEARDSLHRLVSFVELTRYATPRPLDDDRRRQVLAEVEAWREAVRDLAMEPTDVWWPRSVVPRPRG